MVNIDHLYLPFYNEDAYKQRNPVEEETEAIARELDENIQTYKKNKKRKHEMLMREQQQRLRQEQQRSRTKSPTEILLEEMEDEDDDPASFR